MLILALTSSIVYLVHPPQATYSLLQFGIRETKIPRIFLNHSTRVHKQFFAKYCTLLLYQTLVAHNSLSWKTHNSHILGLKTNFTDQKFHTKICLNRHIHPRRNMSLIKNTHTPKEKHVSGFKKNTYQHTPGETCLWDKHLHTHTPREKHISGEKRLTTHGKNTYPHTPGETHLWW